MERPKKRRPSRQGANAGGRAVKVIPHQTLARVFEEMGLGSYEARVLAALVSVGSATAGQLAKLCGVTRPNVYPALDSLSSKALVEAHHGKVTEWVSPGREEVVKRLVQVQEERLQAAQSAVEARAEEALAIVAKMGAESPAPSRAYLQILRNDFDLSDLYFRCFEEATDEVLVFNRGPYPGKIEVPQPILAALARGVRARALYEAAELDDPRFESFRAVTSAFHDAGVECRVVEELPISMAVFDRKVVLFTLGDPVVPETGFDTNVAADHPRFADFCADGFDQLWATARPYEPSDASGAPLARIAHRRARPGS